MTRKDKAIARLHNAVANWIKVQGGNVLITGGPEVQDWHEGTYKFRVAIRCIGRAPHAD